MNNINNRFNNFLYNYVKENNEELQETKIYLEVFTRIKYYLEDASLDKNNILKNYINNNIEFYKNELDKIEYLKDFLEVMVEQYEKLCEEK